MDQINETTTTGYGKKISNSFSGILIGLILFISSFAVLYWNEGRTDMSGIAKNSTEINSLVANADSSINGKLVSTTGNIDTTQTIGDGLYLKPDKFIAVERNVEIYAWEEESQSSSQDNVGGSTTTNTTYTYKKDWVTNPADSSEFKSPTDHVNPTKSISDNSTTATSATVGIYTINPGTISLPEYTAIVLKPEAVTLPPEIILANDTFLFVKKSDIGTIDAPQIGDMRISYKALKPGFNGTVFGKLEGGQITPFFDKEQNKLYRLFAGSRDEGIASLHSEYTIMLWLFRVLGFLMMYFGISMVLGPITALLNILPFLANIGGSLISIIAFVVAFILSVITIIISAILHSIIALISVIIITMALIALFTKFFKKDKAATPINPT